MSESFEGDSEMRIDCPWCQGAGGHVDYWGEYDECEMCHGEGAITQADAWEWQEFLQFMESVWERLGREVDG